MQIDFPSERIIEDYVYSEIKEYGVCPIAGDLVSFCFRQHEITGYGIADLIKVQVTDSHILVTVLELKNEWLKEAHLSQLSRYMTGIGRQLQRYARFSPRPIRVLGELAGPFDASANEMAYLLSRLSGIAVYGLSLSMADGFSAEEVGTGWYRKSENLKGAKPIARKIFESGLLHARPKTNVIEADFGGLN